MEKCYPGLRMFKGFLWYHGFRAGRIHIVKHEVLIYMSKSKKIPEECQNMIIPVWEILSVQRCRVLFLIPAVKLYLKNSEEYVFIVRKYEDLFGYIWSDTNRLEILERKRRREKIIRMLQKLEEFHIEDFQEEDFDDL